MQLLPSTGDRFDIPSSISAPSSHGFGLPGQAWRAPDVAHDRADTDLMAPLAQGGVRKLSQGKAPQPPPLPPTLAFNVGSAVFQSGHSGGVNTVAFSPTDASLLASGSNDNTIRVWNVAEMKQLAVLQGHSAGITSVVFSG